MGGRLALRPTIPAEARSTPTERPTRRGHALTADGIDCGASFVGFAFPARRDAFSGRARKEPSMASGQHPGKRARTERTVGYVARQAQQRVDKRVMEIMSRRDAAARRDSPSQFRRCRRGASSAVRLAAPRVATLRAHGRLPAPCPIRPDGASLGGMTATLADPRPSVAPSTHRGRGYRKRIAALERPLLLAGLALVALHLLDLAFSGPDTSLPGVLAIVAVPAAWALAQPRLTRPTRLAFGVVIGLLTLRLRRRLARPPRRQLGTGLDRRHGRRHDRRRPAARRLRARPRSPRRGGRRAATRSAGGSRTAPAGSPPFPSSQCSP